MFSSKITPYYLTAIFDKKKIDILVKMAKWPKRVKNG